VSDNGVSLFGPRFDGSGVGAKRQSMPVDQLAAYNKPDREQMLYAGAKAEGKVLLG